MGVTYIRGFGIIFMGHGRSATVHLELCVVSLKLTKLLISI